MKALTSSAVSVDGFLPDDVARARDGELAAEERLGGQVVVGDDPVHDDVERALLVGRDGGLAVVELAAEKKRKWGRERFPGFE